MLRSKGKGKAQGAVYVSKMLRPTFPYQRYLAPFMMVNRPARGLQLRNQKTKHLAQITEPRKALTKESAGAGLKGKASSVYSQSQWRIQGRGPAPPLIFRPKWGPKAPKKFFSGRPPDPYLRVWMTSPSPPPHLKVWICHWACTHAVFIQWTNPKEGNDQMTQKLKRRLRQLCLAILDLHN